MENIEQLKTELSPSNAKVTVRLKSRNGFVYEMNFEDDKAIGLIKKLAVFELACMDEGITPYVVIPAAATPVNKPTVSGNSKQDSCQHTEVTKKRSTGGKNIANKDRIYESCLDCGKFMKWTDGGK